MSDWLNPAMFVLFGRRDAVVHQFFAFFRAKSRSSRDPVGHQFCIVRHLSGGNQIHKKSNMFLTFCHVCGCFFSCFPDKSKSGAKKTAKLMPEWIPTGSRRLAKSGAKCKIGADWILTGFGLIPIGSRLDAWIVSDPALPLFSLAVRQPCNNTPSLLHQNGKSSLKPNAVFTNLMCGCGGAKTWTVHACRFYSGPNYSGIY